MIIPYIVTDVEPADTNLSSVNSEEGETIYVNDRKLTFTIQFEPSRVYSLIFGLVSPASYIVTAGSDEINELLLADECTSPSGMNVFRVKKTIREKVCNRKLHSLTFTWIKVELKSLEEGPLKFSHLIVQPPRSVHNSMKNKSFYSEEKASKGLTQKRITDFNCTPRTSPILKGRNETWPEGRCLNMDISNDFPSPEQIAPHKIEHSYSYMLSECIVVINLSDPVTLYKINRICQVCGCILLDAISPEVTHFITDLSDDGSLEAARLYGTRIVLFEWVLESFRQKKRLKETDFVVYLG